MPISKDVPRLSRKLLLAVPIILVLFLIFYLNFYYINTRQMRVGVGQGAWSSPDGYFKITLDLFPVGDVNYLNVGELQAFIEQKHEKVYVMGYLAWNPTVREDGTIVWSAENKKIIYYGRYDGSPCTVTWLDDTTAVVNGITLKLPNQTYDYRRTWETH